MSDRVVSTLLSIFCLSLFLPSPPLRAAATGGPELLPRAAVEKPQVTAVLPGMRADRVVVKFVNDTPVRLLGGNLIAADSALDALLADLRTIAPEARIERLFRRPVAVYEAERLRGERRSGRALADLNNYYLVWLDGNRDPELTAEVADALNRHDLVEIAYPPGRAGDPDDCVDVSPNTPDWVALQDYRTAAPTGIDVSAAWSSGASGRGDRDYWVVDVEQGWNVEHEDLLIDIDDVLNGPYNNEKRDHGTAVLGELAACDNGFGMTGIVPDVRLKTVDWNLENTIAEAFDIAASHLAPGEIYLIEIQTFGPFGALPMEWEQANFDAIETHTALGIVVVEAAGNGAQDLDDESRYGQLFDRSFRDSGAIMVGAGTPGAHSPESFTNYGSRVDCQGYGSSVHTTGYGFLFGPDTDQRYTPSFSGTSSASPIVTGAVAATVLLNHEENGRNLTPLEVRDLVSTYGTPQGPPMSENIGVLPDLDEILGELLPGFGGRIRLDADNVNPAPGSPIELTIEVTNTEASPVEVDAWLELIRAGEDGWAEPIVLAGPATLDLAPGETRQPTLSRTVPAGADLGNYIVSAYLGTFDTEVVSASHIHLEIE